MAGLATGCGSSAEGSVTSQQEAVIQETDAIAEVSAEERTTETVTEVETEAGFTHSVLKEEWQECCVGLD